ncbi:hypothetical protein DM56_5131 [Burkholderia mallei]|nr:hypothetical protein DM56_5131 [Burkholderia mallei]
MRRGDGSHPKHAAGCPEYLKVLKVCLFLLNLRRSAEKGSSRNPGERGADLEEEVLLVAVPVSAALDDLDRVVDAFDDAGIERMAAAGHDSVPVTLQALGELLQGGDPALLSLFEPFAPKPFPRRPACGRTRAV